ncbi:curli assembly protein CsgG [Opitutaceae bacterium TAV5]|nr:curli assembly protein CsgG [Opitutaceae bacterium TAV5]
MNTHYIPGLARHIAGLATALALCAGVASAASETSAVAATDVDQPLPMAVFDFQTTDRSLDKKGAEVATLLNAHLSMSPDVFLVERQEVEKILGEQELGLSGTVTPDSVAKVGALVGAKVLVTGRLFESGGKVYAVAKIMSAETGRVYGEMATAKNFDDIETAVTALSEKIVKVTTARADTLLAKVETPEARLERYKKLLGAADPAKLPSVYVTIAEQHLARPVIDPAVQTELMLVLRQIGFTVLSADEAAKRSDAVTITGEAFSELGMRRGNLVSCRSRVEITVKDGSGKLLLADRQMDVAIDIAEHIAGKKALENAALKLLDRILPALAGQAR